MAMQTEIYLRADTRIDEQPVPIEATIGKEFFLQLARPATLGTPVSFGYWLHETYKTKVDLLILDDLEGNKKITTAAQLRALARSNPTELQSRLEAHLAKQGIPDKVQKLLAKALLAKITITDLLIDGRKTKNDGKVDKDGGEVDDVGGLKLRFGLEVSFNETGGLDILPNIILDTVTLVVSRFPEGYKFPPRVLLPTIEPMALPAPSYASGYIEFSDNPVNDGKITLNVTGWTLVDGTPTGNQTKRGDDLNATLAALVEDLNGSDDENVSKCSYKVDGKRLIITYNEAAPAGQDFAIAADAKSRGRVSDAKLSVGEEEKALPEPAHASGFITFATNPAANGTIALNGTEWTFVDGTPAAKQTKRGGNLSETLDALVAGLNASSDKNVKRCEYSADKQNGRLVIKYKEAGSAGENFAIGADSDSKGTASGAKLSLGG